MANTTPTGPKGFPIPKPPASGATAQDSVTVHVLGFDQITRENFRVKLQAQAELTGGRDPEGLPLGFFLNGILLGKAAFDDFGVADIALTIDWAALQKGKALTVRVKGMEQAVPVTWNVPEKIPKNWIESRLKRLKSDKLIYEDESLSYLSKRFGVPSIELQNCHIEDPILEIIPIEIILKYIVIPINEIGGTLTLAMANPSDIFAIEDIKFMTNCYIEPVVASKMAIINAIEKFYLDKT